MLVSCNFILTKVEIFPKWNFGRKLCLLWAVLQHQIEKTLIFHLGLTKGSWHHKSHSRSRRFWRSLHLWHSLWQNLWHSSTLTSVKSAFNLFSLENCNTRAWRWNNSRYKDNYDNADNCRQPNHNYVIFLYTSQRPVVMSCKHCMEWICSLSNYL